MPQVDLETIVSVCGVGGDRKIACETLADGGQPPEVPNLPDVPPDFPPESVSLSKEAELDWLDRNAVYERKESTKGNSNSFAPNPNSTAPIQRFPMNLMAKASIIGLPKTNYADSKRKTCKPANIRMFPKRSASIEKTIVSVTEPSSPKVSCMGRVRSKRGRRKSSEATNTETTEKSLSSVDRRKSGSRGGFTSMFRCCRCEKTVEIVVVPPPPAESPPRKSVARRMREIPVSDEPVAEPPGLGGMNRFTSGRRSATWLEDGMDDVAPPKSLDRDLHVLYGPTGRS